MNNDLSFTGILGVALVVTIVAFGLLMVAATFTILSVNTLFASIIIPLTLESVSALAWIKFWLGIMFSGVIKIKKD